MSTMCAGILLPVLIDRVMSNWADYNEALLVIDLKCISRLMMHTNYCTSALYATFLPSLFPCPSSHIFEHVVPIVFTAFELNRSKAQEYMKNVSDAANSFSVKVYTHATIQYYRERVEYQDLTMALSKMHFLKVPEYMHMIAFMCCKFPSIHMNDFLVAYNGCSYLTMNDMYCPYMIHDALCTTVAFDPLQVAQQYNSGKVFTDMFHFGINAPALVKWRTCNAIANLLRVLQTNELKLPEALQAIYRNYVRSVCMFGLESANLPFADVIFKL